MQVAKITSTYQHNPNFQRRLRPEEERDYRQNALQPAFDYL